jgi:hypothetical protein
VAKLDPFEGFPNWYNRVPIELTLPDCTTVQGQAYIQVKNEKFIHPFMGSYKIDNIYIIQKKIIRKYKKYKE